MLKRNLIILFSIFFLINSCKGQKDEVSSKNVDNKEIIDSSYFGDWYYVKKVESNNYVFCSENSKTIKIQGTSIKYSTLMEDSDFLNYNSSGVVIKYTFTQTKRRYTDPDYLAVFIGTLANCAFNDVQTTGSCFSEASCFPSVEHVNGKSIDTLYLDDVREQKLIDAFNKFGITKQLRGSKKKAFAHTLDGKALHNSHLHSGIIQSDKIKIIKEK